VPLSVSVEQSHASYGRLFDAVAGNELATQVSFSAASPSALLTRAVQHALPPRHFLCVLSSGLIAFTRQRPLEQLTQALASGDSSLIEVRSLCRPARAAC
jgi:hypothetical protein